MLRVNRVLARQALGACAVGAKRCMATMLPRVVTAQEAVRVVNSNDRILLHGVSMMPHVLLNALVERADELRDVEIYQIHTEGDAPHTRPEYAESFRSKNFFIGRNTRAAVQRGQAEYIPVFLSEIGMLFRRGVIPLDVAFAQVSPPDRHGFCSYGTSTSVIRAGVEAANVVIAQVNKHVPRTFGAGVVHMSELDYIVHHDEPLVTIPRTKLTETDREIGRNVATLVEDGATLQMGIGVIPDACLQELRHRRDLGIHTEMFSDGVMDLVKCGAITGRCKKHFRGKIVASFAMGTPELYEFMDENQGIEMLESHVVNDPKIIKLNPKVTAINSAIEIDLSGQVCADSIGSKLYSGVGGQMDFMRGAALSEGGKPIIAMHSTTGSGESKIVPMLRPGSGVVTTRAHMHYVVTEFGVADLYGKSTRERADELIRIAHPDHREALEKAKYDAYAAMH